MLQTFVTGLRSNPNFTDEINVAAGISPSKLRVHILTVLKGVKEYNKYCTATHRTMERRRVKRQVQAHLMEKEENKATRHKTEKMNPIESVIKLRVKRKQ